MMMINEGSMQMVWFHELGHLFRGHLELSQSHAIEFEADHFAFAALAQTEHYKLREFYLGLGALTPLVLLDIMETIDGSTEGRSHPSAKRRLNAALTFLRRVNPAMARNGHKFLLAVAALCNPTLQKNWGVSIGYS